MSSILALHSVLFGKCGLAISLVLASIATTFQPNGYALSLGGKPSSSFTPLTFALASETAKSQGLPAARCPSVSAAPHGHAPAP